MEGLNTRYLGCFFSYLKKAQMQQHGKVIAEYIWIDGSGR